MITTRLSMLRALAFLVGIGAALGLPSAAAASEGRGYLLIGARDFQLAGLNTGLKAAGYGPFHAPALIVGGGGYALRADGLLIGGEGFIVNPKTTSEPGSRAEMRGAFGFFDLGYVLVRTDSHRFSLLAGLGGGSLTLIAGRGTGTWPEIVGHRDHSAHLTKSGALARLGILAETTIPWSGNDKALGGLRLGLRLGWHFALDDRDWESEGLTVPGGPRLSLAGPSASLVIGLSGAGRSGR